MKKTTYILFVLSIAFLNVNGQNLINSMTTVKGNKLSPVDGGKKQPVSENDGGKRLGKGFALTAIAAINRGASFGDYVLVNPNVSSSSSNYKLRYPLENAFGYNFGAGLGFQGPHYGLELVTVYHVDRFNVPSLSSTSALSVQSLEFGLCHYFKFLKEKHYIVFGGYYAIDMGDYDGDHSLGWNLGYGYNFSKRLNLSLRYKYNILGLDEEEDIRFTPDLSGSIYYRHSFYNSLLFVLRFDMINTRRLKSNNDKYKNYNTHTVNPIVPYVPTRVTIDYSTYSDADLKQALANSKNIDDMQLIQKEIDKRKPIDYSTYTDADLKQALINSKNINNSQLIQKEMDKRKPVNEFDKYSNSQLKDLLDASVAKEDYDGAEKIKNEMANRKKTIDNLKILLDNAVKKEDFDKAAEIQEEIKKLEK